MALTLPAQKFLSLSLVDYRFPDMREDGPKEELLLRRLYERSAELCVLRQRLDILLQVPLSDTTRYSDAGDHGTRPSDSSCIPTDVTDPTSDTAQGERLVSHSQQSGNRETLMGCIARVRGSAERQAGLELNRAIPASSTTVDPGQHSEALRALLCTPSVTSIPSLRGVASGDPQSRTRASSASAPSTSTAPGDLREATATGDGSAITYRMFLTRLMRPESKGFVRAIRMFLFSIIGNGGDVSSLTVGPSAAAGGAIPPDLEDVEIYGSSFLVQRCAEFFLAMQNAMGVHPSWAELGYDSIVTCREHLERFVMTKIHPLAFGRKLNGAVDASISSRLRALQFLTPDHLGVVAHARDDKVLGLAQDELRKMNSGRCPGDMLSRVVRCCDIIFALLDQGRRDRPKIEGCMGPHWRPDLDPASTADDFLPVLILVVLRANVPRLHSMSEYVQAYHSPVALMSRPGYCFVALRSAVEFLMTLTGAEVGMSELQFRRRALETMRGASSAPVPATTAGNG